MGALDISMTINETETKINNFSQLD